jgi:hypothetical protein
MNTIIRTPETIELNARLKIVRLHNLTFKTPKGSTTVRGYGFRIAGLGYVRFKAHAAGIPYSPIGGKRALQSIIDDGGFTDYSNISFVHAVNEPTGDFTFDNNKMMNCCYLKTRHPDALITVRNDTASPASYEFFFNDAHIAADILGRKAKLVERDAKLVPVFSFPCKDLDAALQKIIRAGQRIAICDIEPPKRVIKRR